MNTARLLAGLLVLLTLAAYWPVRDAQFINLDDPQLVSENPRIREGLTWKSVRWALEADLLYDSRYADYWQPVTLLSRMADIQMFGTDASWHHMENVLIHVINALLLFGVLRWMTGAVWRSGLVAAIFALHPLHVEAVAWVTERKEVLGGLFWILTLWAYAWYAQKPGASRYGCVVLGMALGLMAKPVGIVLPGVLLLLDCWPLERTRTAGWTRLLAEKVPLAAMALFSAVVTLRMQGGHVAAGSAAHVAGAALIGYATYVIKAVAPTGLSVWHPSLEQLPAGAVLGSMILLGLISWGCWRRQREQSFWFVGWGWFGLGLLPVVFLKDVAWAERFTYLPLVGLGIMVAWGLPERWFEKGRSHWVATTAVALVLAAMLAGTWRQAGYWRDSVTLFQRALAVSKGDEMIYHNFGTALAEKGYYEEARWFFVETLRLNPNSPKTRTSLGTLLIAMGRDGEGIYYLQQALRQGERLPETYNNLGFALMRTGRLTEAKSALEEAVRLNPEFPEAKQNLGLVLAGMGRFPEATVRFEEALRLKPDDVEAHHNLGCLLTEQRMGLEAKAHFQYVLENRADYLPSLNQLAWLLATSTDASVRNGQEAVRLAERACALTQRKQPRSLAILAAAYAAAGRFQDAQTTAQAAIKFYSERKNTRQAQQTQQQLAQYRSRHSLQGGPLPGE